MPKANFMEIELLNRGCRGYWDDREGVPLSRHEFYMGPEYHSIFNDSTTHPPASPAPSQRWEG